MPSPSWTPKHDQSSPTWSPSAETIDALQHKNSKKEPSFICTICWQHQYPPDTETAPSSSSGPKLLGSTARIVCHPCWRAVLNLSICWVCGECIVRGDEVISLGWCFWHCACFGCLICGTRISVPERDDNCFKESGRRRSHSRSEATAGKQGRRTCGVELAEIPLCDVCEIETAGDSQSEVLEKGLENVSSFDGGLSRDRLGMSSEEVVESKRALLRSNRDSSHSDGELRLTPRRLIRAHRKLKGATGVKTELKKSINDSSIRSCGQAHRISGSPEERKPLLFYSADMGISEDSTTERRHRPSDAGCTNCAQPLLQEQPEIYISILDPLGGLPFKQSSTKPHPKWMSLLPSNVTRAREQPRTFNQDDVPGSHQQRKKNADSYFSNSSGGFSPVPSNRTPRDSAVPIERPLSPINIQPAGKRTRNGSFDGDRHDVYEKYVRISRKSPTFNSIYSTPPEFPGKSTIGQQRTFLPPITRPGLGIEKTSSYVPSDQNSNTQAGSIASRGCPTLTDLQREIIFPSRSDAVELPTPKPLSPRTYSSEYLEIYQPVTSITHHKKYVSKRPEAIIERIKRQRVGNKNMAQIAEDTMQKRSSQSKNSEQTSKLGTRREDLKNELRSLFYGEIENNS